MLGEGQFFVLFELLLDSIELIGVFLVVGVAVKVLVGVLVLVGVHCCKLDLSFKLNNLRSGNGSNKS